MTSPTHRTTFRIGLSVECLLFKTAPLHLQKTVARQGDTGADDIDAVQGLLAADGGLVTSKGKKPSRMVRIKRFAILKRLRVAPTFFPISAAVKGVLVRLSTAASMPTRSFSVAVRRS